MALTLDHPEGATPLDPDEADGLIPEHISTQGELNQWEQQNILEGERWAFGRRHPEILVPAFLRELHKRMFGQTWKWAGKYRTSGKNIGIESTSIAPAIKDLCEDVKTQLASKVWPVDEIAARMHHRLTLIHPFPNGNGRFSRTMTDLMLVANGAERFSWGAGDLAAKGQIRQQYLEALRAADGKDYSKLLAFVRSSSTGV